jgi:hypothetical protein
MINLTMTPEVVIEPEWVDYGYHHKFAKGQKHLPSIKQPFFHSHTVTTQISLYDGATVIVGGGMNSRDNTKVVYAFMSARVVDPGGKPIRKKH